MSTPSAEPVRVSILRLYLAPKDNIAALEETVAVINEFIEAHFGGPL